MSTMTGPLTLSDQVRRDCRRVAERARWVRVDRQRIASYSAALDPQQLRLPTLDRQCHYLGQGEATVAFMLTLEAVNFGSANLSCLRQDEQRSGYFTVAGALTRYFQRHGPIAAQQLARLGLNDCAKIFDQEDHPPATPLLHRFAVALKGFGEHLLTHFDGDFSRLLAAAEGSAQCLAALLAEVESFRDQAVYAGQTVRIYKRAQLTAADLSLAFSGRGPGELAGLDQLTLFADDLVPHVLRSDGILRYDPVLAGRIDRGELLPAGSAEEVEIRACAVQAAELITAQLRACGLRACAMQVDYCLWNRGLGAAYRRRPRHRTVTDFY